MKKIILIFATVFALAALSAGAFAQGGKASIKFDKKVHDFGTVKEDGGSVTCVFDFTNEGDGNLIIFDATADCGCTKPTFSKAPIAPGKKGKITVSYNPFARPGGFDKTVTVKCNGKPSKVKLKIRGTVMPK